MPGQYTFNNVRLLNDNNNTQFKSKADPSLDLCFAPTLLTLAIQEEVAQVSHVEGKKLQVNQKDAEQPASTGTYLTPSVARLDNVTASTCMASNC